MNATPSGSTTVVSFSGLNAAFLGPYGGSWVPTPCLDRLAANGVVFDRLFAESDSADAVLRSMWTGAHPARGAAGGSWSLPRGIAAQGRDAVLVCDDTATAELGSDVGFGRVIYVPLAAPEAAVDDPADSHLATLMAEAIELVGEAPLLWVHSVALERVWDAPLAMRAALADEEGPAALADVLPRRIAIDAASDPDRLLAWSLAYAAQIGLVDFCLDPLRAAAQRRGAADDRLAITGVSGMATGEHGFAGPGEGPVRASRLHLPMIYAGGGVPPVRVGSVCGASDLAPTLAAGLLAADEVPEEARERDLSRRWSPAAWAAGEEGEPCASIDAEGASLFTGGWHLRREQDRSQLFVKPDDRFDVNDVASRMPEVTESLEGTLAAMRRAVAGPQEPS